jgi:hypothetical protein
MRRCRGAILRAFRQLCRPRQFFGMISPASRLLWGDIATFFSPARWTELKPQEVSMHSVIYIIGLIVVIMFILSFLGLR